MTFAALTIREARERLRRRQISSVELTQAFLARIGALNPRLNAYLTITDDEALEMARQADARIQRGEDTPCWGADRH